MQSVPFPVSHIDIAKTVATSLQRLLRNRVTMTCCTQDWRLENLGNTRYWQGQRDINCNLRNDVASRAQALPECQKTPSEVSSTGNQRMGRG